MRKLLFLLVILTCHGAQVHAQVPEPANCSVEPWDTYFKALIVPGPFDDADVTIIVRDILSNPLDGVLVEIDLSACTDLCIDTPDGLSGYTDMTGTVVLNPRAGGCEDCSIVVRADGVVIATYSKVISPDWDGNWADGIVNIEDSLYFMSVYLSTEECADYNVDGFVDLADYGLFGGWYNHSNDVTCLSSSCNVVTTDIDYAFLNVGQSTDTTFTIYNPGGTTLVGSVSESCDHYSIVSGGGSYSIPPGGSREVTVRFEPTVPGTHNCIVETGDTLCSDVYLTGESDDAPLCGVSPTFLFFDSLMVGETKDLDFMITNLGGGVLAGTVSESCSHYSIVGGGGGYSIAAGETLFVTVRYEPTTPGDHYCNILTTPCSEVNCEGYRFADPVCEVDPEILDFGTMYVGEAKDLDFVIRNNGGPLLEGNVSETCIPFRIISGNGAFSLGAGDSVVVTVRYEPAPLAADTCAEGTDTCLVETGQLICSDVFLTGTLSTDPLVMSIEDIGNDQGRSVRIEFARSARDCLGSMTPIVQYEAFRRIDPLPVFLSHIGGRNYGTVMDQTIAQATEAGMLSDTAILLQGWEYVGAVPAHGEGQYSMISPTLADSTISAGMHWSFFFIRAATDEPLVYFDSPPDSGYSIDNLAPGVPLGLSVAYNSSGGNELSWEQSEDEDFMHFKVYRSTDCDFIPSQENLVHMLVQPGWTDPVIEGWRYCYKITAVDFSGNESGAGSAESVTGVEDTGTPGAFALYQNTPNPFNPITVIRYDVPAGGGRVTLRIFDVNGRLVRTLVDEMQEAGHKSTVWDGVNQRGVGVASGLYFYRMKASGFQQIRKLVLLR